MKKQYIWILLFAGFLARLFAFSLNFHFDNDVMTFQLWAIRMFEGGPSNFYSDYFFADYPPVYMYVLYLLGALRAGVQGIFGNEYWHVLSCAEFRFFTFLPAILADLGIGFVIYKVAARFGGSDEASPFPLFVAAAWLFNPAVILISASWGQVESVFVLMLLGSLLFLQDKKLLPAYILFGLAIFTKPQSLFLGPVYLYSAYDFLRVNKYSGKAVLQLAVSILAGVGVMVLAALPFGLETTARTLLYGMEMYGHASVNASNFWAMIGQNWGALDSTLLGITYASWGYAIVFAIIATTLAALHIDYTRHNGKHFFLIVAALFVVIFAFSVRMHERYLFPALAFLLVYYLENRQRREFIFYWAFSAVFFLNCLEVLRWANEGFDWALLDNSSLRAVSFLMVFLAGALIFVLVKSLRERYFNAEDASHTDEVSASKKRQVFASRESAPPMRRYDFVNIILLVAVYSVIAFVNLGDMQSPQTTWVAGDGNDGTVLIDFLEPQHFSRFQYLLGQRHDVGFTLRASFDGEYWTELYSTNGGSVFAWHFADIHTYARYIEIDARHGLRLQEMAFRGADGEVIRPPIIKSDPLCWCCNGAAALFDEYHLLPESRNFMNSTYFDEIYHPRTGYEFVHGLTVYETTHPPLGKVFMAASIRLFGMTPFAWRLPGTLFGIFMLPLLYAFARKLLKSNNLALFATFIFAFDFMLFSHTRLATIDSFVTFFVLAMYFCMYRYTTEIERNSLRKSLTLLAICGACMGLAIASKWQGVYGAIGLPILFFPALYKLYLRDKRQGVITFFSCFGLFVAIPIVIYVLSYIPFVYSMATPERGFFATIWDNQNLMLNYHSLYVLGATHPFASPWWTWPLIITPLWQYQTVVSDTVRAGMSSMGNPAVWWFGIVATGFAIYGLAKKSRFEYDTVFLLVAYSVNFLPWVFITRLTFIYHYFPSVAFVVLLIALFFKRYVKRDFVYFAYAAIVLALFVLFYPVLAGRPIRVDFVEEYLRWFSQWFLV
ncbi:MAG: phospholipid carrier-dependent glycosyltransferase [Defluviitaleaceae bacterium]|nr:phospholipid carrier-dependent glycosyltransferase [Defluviitaleaceae bacterium]MCL2263558.1 phospholipid carrier-dependent glycosyltransferase [Defluviitaleaceae bacterium]